MTRARITQLGDILWLAPDIVEEVAFSVHHGGVERITERALRAVVREPSWAEQRRLYLDLKHRFIAARATPRAEESK
jgi:hypothetical protein